MNILVITGAALAVYFVLVWFLGSLLGLKATDLWILRGGLALIGVIVAGAYYWYSHEEPRRVGAFQRRAGYGRRTILERYRCPGARGGIPPGFLGTRPQGDARGHARVPDCGPRGIGEDVRDRSIRPGPRAAGRERVPGEHGRSHSRGELLVRAPRGVGGGRRQAAGRRRLLQPPAAQAAAGYAGAAVRQGRAGAARGGGVLLLRRVPPARRDGGALGSLPHSAGRSRRSRQVLWHTPPGVCGLHEDGPDSVLRRLRPQSQQ